MSRRYELKPNDSHKSFYKKAYVEVSNDGTETLYSYGAPIVSRHGSELKRLWYGYSRTTQRHIVAFCGLNKTEFDKL